MDKYKDKGLTGLANLGNTCFINSTIQCLSHSYELNEILDNKIGLLNRDEKTKYDALITKEWNDLRELMWSSNCKISPKGFIVSVHKVAQAKDRVIFTGYTQNDLPEFLLFLIDSFHEAMKRKVTISIKGSVLSTVDELAKDCYTMMKNMYEKEYSEILKMFYGIHVSLIKDLEGNILSKKPEPYFMIDLPIPNKKMPNIYDCFDKYTEGELLDGDNKWLNDKTGEKIAVNKEIKFFNFPDVLIIDFKRFNNMMNKNQVLIDFPLEDLDLSKYVIGYNKDKYKYDLYGICNHSGSTMGGHYTAYVKNANGKWYLFNDLMVTEVPEDKIVTPKAYCLFYRIRK